MDHNTSVQCLDIIMLCEIKGGSHTSTCTVEQRLDGLLAINKFCIGTTIRNYSKLLRCWLHNQGSFKSCSSTACASWHVVTSPRCKPESSHKLEGTLSGVKNKLRTRVETYLSSQDSMAQATVSPEGRASSPSCL